MLQKKQLKLPKPGKPKAAIQPPPAQTPAAPDYESFGWQVLTALTSDVVTSREGHLQWVSFTVRSSIAACSGKMRRMSFSLRGASALR